MGRYFVCCEQCFKKISEKDQRTAKIWMDACALHVLKGSPFEVVQDFPEFNLLEEMGHLVTTDSYDKIRVKVTSHRLDDKGQDFFCGGHNYDD